MVQQIVASDIESIRNAAQILNSRLTSRAYIDNNILFNCINWKRLVSDQIEELPQLNDLIISEKLYNNDKNTINLIHALLNIIDKQRSHQTIVTETITNKDAKIESLQKQVNQLTKKINDTERETRNKVIKYTSMQSRINELTKQNKSFSDDLNKVKNWTMDTKNKYKVEMKRKNLEIESLQNKLIERSRNIPTAIEYAGGSSNSSDGLMVQNNYPIIENSTGLIINNPDLVADLNIQKEIADSSNKFVSIIESIAKENFKFTTFLNSFKNYFAKMNSALSDFRYKNFSIDKLPNPSDLIDLKQIMVDPEKMQQYFNELEPSENIATSTLNECYKLFHNIEYLINNITQNGDINNDSAIAKLTEDIGIMKSNWQKALETSEKWKNIAQTQQRE